MLIQRQTMRTGPGRRAGLILIVALLHLLLLAWLAFTRVAPMPALPSLPPVEVLLVPFGGGGRSGEAASAAVDTPPRASSLRRPERPVRREDSPIAPPQPAPPQLDIGVAPLPGVSSEPSLVVSADSQSGAAGSGGGVGGGVGPGVGSGVGAGRGRGSGAVLIRGPQGAVISREVDPASMAAHAGPHAVLRCRIRSSGRLDSCRVVQESAGAGARALRDARQFRFRPQIVGGRVSDRGRTTIGIAYPAAAAPAG